MAFSRDGKMLALLMAPGQVRLVDPATGRALATLQAPNTEPIAWLGFTPDGGQLLIGSGMHGHVHVWDLRLIGRQLETLGLSWGLSLSSPANSPVDAKPMKVEVEIGELGPALKAYEQFARGETQFRAKQWKEALSAFSAVIELQPAHASAWHLRGLAYYELGEGEKALADLSKAVQFAESDPQVLNNLAWLLVTCPETRLRDVARAIPLSKKAVQLAPQNGVCWNTLGVVQYRAENWKEAIEALGKSMELRKGGDSFDFFFLAMAHWRLNQQEQARQWYTRAVEWMDKHHPKDNELIRFRAEAAELLEMKEQK
jgi:tetratricopeptide (TPR) repeat protein